MATCGLRRERGTEIGESVLLIGIPAVVRRFDPRRLRIVAAAGGLPAGAVHRGAPQLGRERNEREREREIEMGKEEISPPPFLYVLTVPSSSLSLFLLSPFFIAD